MARNQKLHRSVSPGRMGENPDFRTETAPDCFSSCHGGGKQKERATQATKEVSKRFKSTPAGAKSALERARAKQVKEALLEEIRQAIAKAPSLLAIISRFCDKITIRVPRGTWKVWNYRECLKEVLARVKRLKISPGNHFRQSEPPTRAEGRRYLREAKRLARRGNSKR